MALKIDAAELNYVLAKVFPEVPAATKLFDFLKAIETWWPKQT